MVHTDDFLIASRNPQEIMDQLQEIYTIKNPGSPTYMLGFDIKRRKNFWIFGSKLYVKQEIEHVEKLFGTLRQERIPMVAGDYPENNESPLLEE